MFIEPQQIINSRFGIGLVSTLGRVLPPRLGYGIARFAAGRIAARRDWKMVQAVRANQWVACGGKLEKEALDMIVRETFHTIARSTFDLYHYIHDQDALHRLIVIDPVMRQFIRRPAHAERGLMLVGLHLSNFDLIFQACCLQGLSALVLTIPELPGGYRLQYEMRRRSGMNLVPTSVGALRQAVEHLRAGGLVMTGIDRPIPKPRYRPLFFGQPASLPIHHVYLALKARVPVVLIATLLQPDGKYHILTSDPIEMLPHPDQHKRLLMNAESVLRVAEDFIRLAPQQWSMTLPVWPEVLDQVAN